MNLMRKIFSLALSASFFMLWLHVYAMKPNYQLKFYEQFNEMVSRSIGEKEENIDFIKNLLSYLDENFAGGLFVEVDVFKQNQSTVNNFIKSVEQAFFTIDILCSNKVTAKVPILPLNDYNMVQTKTSIFSLLKGKFFPNYEKNMTPYSSRLMTPEFSAKDLTNEVWKIFQTSFKEQSQVLRQPKNTAFVLQLISQIGACDPLFIHDYLCQRGGLLDKEKVTGLIANLNHAIQFPQKMQEHKIFLVELLKEQIEGKVSVSPADISILPAGLQAVNPVIPFFVSYHSAEGEHNEYLFAQTSKGLQIQPGEIAAISRAEQLPVPELKIAHRREGEWVDVDRVRFIYLVDGQLETFFKNIEVAVDARLRREIDLIVVCSDILLATSPQYTASEKGRANYLLEDPEKEKQSRRGGNTRTILKKIKNANVDAYICVKGDFYDRCYLNSMPVVTLGDKIYKSTADSKEAVLLFNKDVKGLSREQSIISCDLFLKRSNKKDQISFSCSVQRYGNENEFTKLVCSLVNQEGNQVDNFIVDFGISEKATFDEAFKKDVKGRITLAVENFGEKAMAIFPKTVEALRALEKKSTSGQIEPEVSEFVEKFVAENKSLSLDSGMSLRVLGFSDETQRLKDAWDKINTALEERLRVLTAGQIQNLEGELTNLRKDLMAIYVPTVDNIINMTGFRGRTSIYADIKQSRFANNLEINGSAMWLESELKKLSISEQDIATIVSGFRDMSIYAAPEANAELAGLFVWRHAIERYVTCNNISIMRAKGRDEAVILEAERVAKRGRIFKFIRTQDIGITPFIDYFSPPTQTGMYLRLNKGAINKTICGILQFCENFQQYYASGSFGVMLKRFAENENALFEKHCVFYHSQSSIVTAYQDLMKAILNRYSPGRADGLDRVFRINTWDWWPRLNIEEWYNWYQKGYPPDPDKSWLRHVCLNVSTNLFAGTFGTSGTNYKIDAESAFMNLFQPFEEEIVFYNSLMPEIVFYNRLWQREMDANKLAEARNMFNEVIAKYELGNNQAILQIIIPDVIVPDIVYISKGAGTRYKYNQKTTVSILKRKRSISRVLDFKSYIDDPTDNVQAEIYLHPTYFLNRIDCQTDCQRESGADLLIHHRCHLAACTTRICVTKVDRVPYECADYFDQINRIADFILKPN